MNTKYIKASKIHRLLHNAHIYDHKNIDKSIVDIMICNVAKGKQNIEFEEFIQILGRLSLLIYTGKETINDKQVAISCMQRVLTEHIFKYLDNLCAANQEVILSFPDEVGATFKRIFPV